MQGVERQPLLEGLQDGAETAYSGSCFHTQIVLGKKEYRCAFAVDCGKQNLMLCPLDALAGMRDGVAGIATSAVGSSLRLPAVRWMGSLIPSPECRDPLPFDQLALVVGFVETNGASTPTLIS